MNLKEENEKLRELLRRVYNYVPIPDQIRIDSALSQQNGNEVASPEQQPVAFRVLRRNHDGIWTTDGRDWLDGVPDAGLLGDISERSDRWRLEYAYAARPAQTAWTSVEDRLPDPAQHARVLIYTAGYDFAGEQYFDVKAESLNEYSFGDPDDQPEPYSKATHWMPLPDTPGLSSQQANKI